MMASQFPAVSMMDDSQQDMDDFDVSPIANKKKNMSTTSSDRRGSVSDLIDILNDAEEVLEGIVDDANDNELALNHQDDHLDLSFLEPTPINPNGVQTVVPQVSLHQVHHNNDDNEAMRRLLRPLILKAEDENRKKIMTMMMMKQLSQRQQSQQQVTSDRFSLLECLGMSSTRASKRRCLSFPTSKLQDDQPQAQHPLLGTLSSDSMNSSSSVNNNDLNPVALDNENHLTSAAEGTSSSSSSSSRFRSYQSDQWKDRFQELIEFKQAHGHCLVPHTFPMNQKLAQWTKRQRYQYKLKHMGRHSTLTDAREVQLGQLGFVWDSHKAAWGERLESLKEFLQANGHCSVASNFHNKGLAIWVKYQRRQYRLFVKGQRSTMTTERFQELEALGFDWDPRKLES